MKKLLTLAAMLSALSLPATSFGVDFSDFSPSVRIYGTSTDNFKAAFDFGYKLTDSINFAIGPLFTKALESSIGASASVKYNHDIGQSFTPYVNANIATTKLLDKPLDNIIFRGSIGINISISSQASFFIGYYLEKSKNDILNSAMKFFGENGGPELGINFKF
ncbi:hypothetical protein [Wolbachia endosymbiont of Chironomus riparius]|uniref:hypothetical protein n=1 Tax=Wolbachia endosymbiont of Chironomus riparius TaxID=2883238 RepID=UPI00209D3850|nr:hypothetical protein [Wolbachia endosymbiont of Chironomus riparius]